MVGRVPLQCFYLLIYASITLNIFYIDYILLNIFSQTPSGIRLLIHILLPVLLLLAEST